MDESNLYAELIPQECRRRLRQHHQRSCAGAFQLESAFHQHRPPENDKKLDVMVDVFARSILAGRNLGFPQARDSVIASEVSWAMLNDAISHVPPVRGTPEEMQQILEHRRNLANGYGLPVKTLDLPENELVTG